MPRQYKTGGYQRRHYEDMAGMLKESTGLDDFRDRLENKFAGDNPRFDRSRFRKAAGY